MVCVSPAFSPAVVAWKVVVQLMPSIVPIPIIGPVMVSRLACQWP